MLRPLITFQAQTTQKSDLELNVRSVEDVPGHLPPENQANLARIHRPQVLVLMIDLTDRNCRTWVRDFFKAYRGELSTKARWPRHGLSCLAILMNKYDKVTEATKSMRERHFRKLLPARLGDVLENDLIASTPILPCICVANTHGTHSTQYIDQAILAIAKRIAKRG